ncbi:hypothetical protein QQS21_002671 [Conoideocrella luteorostrata]|uniref:Ricin B lectin domain-containing protein n=1 Tax=Conoideocrella luteorostrata TaxID=1105319 RepID=A0AAJ0CXC3_9HYPO|nr:hypothetical protein QQS21_002671 [Conoideocrella luteorostrata]
MGEFTPAKLDPNVWYHVTEGRVDDYKKTSFQSSFQILNPSSNNGDKLAVFPIPSPPQYWQFLPVDPTNPARYVVRNSERKIMKQLGTCYNSDEIDEQHIQPCMLRSDGADTQKWDITLFPSNNETYRFQNVQNGTKFNMDVHPGNPMFMSSDTDPKIYQPAQRWLLTSVKNIDEAAFSTTFTKVPTTSTTSTATTDGISTSTPKSSTTSSGLSSGAAAGVGIGVTLAVIALALAGFFLWRRRGRASKPNRRDYSASLGENGQYYMEHQDVKAGSLGVSPAPQYSSYEIYNRVPQQPTHEMLHNPAPQEVSAEMQYELPASSTPSHSQTQIHRQG